MQESQPTIEKASFALLQELHELLVDGLNSLGGKQSTGPEQNYLVSSVKHVGAVVLGYIAIRKQAIRGLDYASKLLVRPIIETTFYVAATFRTPGFLLWKAKNELEEEKRLLNAAGPEGQSRAKELDKAFEQLNQWFRARDPNYPTECSERWTVKAAADKAGLSLGYTYQYSIYCKYTHGALRAITGGFDEITNDRDNAILSWCLIVILDLLRRHAPAEVPDLNPYYDRLSKLHGDPLSDLK